MALCVLERERGRGRLSPSSFTPPLLLRRWVTDPERSVQSLGDRSAQHGWHHQCAVRRGKWRKTSIWRVFMFTFSLVELVLSLKLGVMSQCCCRQVLLGVELGILVAVLVAGSAGQIHDRREAGSSCYGGFDLYFVLDKWVLLLLFDPRGRLLVFLVNDSSDIVLKTQVQNLQNGPPRH